MLAFGLFAALVVVLIRRLSRQSSDGRKNSDPLDYFGFARIACQHANDGLVVMNMSGIIQWVNPAYCRIMGYAADEMIGQNPRSFALLPHERPPPGTLVRFRLDADTPGPETLELVENIRKDGSVFWNQISMSFHTTSDGAQYAVVVCRDVSANVENEKQLEATSKELAHIAAHDHLTGAANRAELLRFLKNALKQAKKTGARVGVLHIDLDKFKQTNDMHGHSAGDAVLVATVERLTAEVRDIDLVARIGGDEFIVVCKDLNSLKDLKNIGLALSQAVNKPVPWQKMNLTSQISVGAALSNPAITDPDEMLVQSDFALYDVKRSGRGRVATYSAELHRRHTQVTQRQTDLQAAIRDKAMTFHFQPVVGKEPGVVRGLETLVRWQHPSDGMIPPDELLPIAQSLGLMAELDFLAMNAALDMKSDLNRHGHNDVLVSFNASSELLAHDDFCAALLSGLAFRELSVDDVIVEVLETVLFEDHLTETPFVQKVSDLDAAGIFTVLDDFGSGNAGIAQLARLAIRGVKFDKSLGMRILTDPAMEIVYRTLTQLCMELDLRMVTEGVETEAQVNRLMALGCTNIQGFLISKPMPQDQVFTWLDTYTASAIAPSDAHRYLKAN